MSTPSRYAIAFGLLRDLEARTGLSLVNNVIWDVHEDGSLTNASEIVLKWDEFIHLLGFTNLWSPVAKPSPAPAFDPVVRPLLFLAAVPEAPGADQADPADDRAGAAAVAPAPREPSPAEPGPEPCPRCGGRTASVRGFLGLKRVCQTCG